MTLYAALILGIGAMLLIGMAFRPKPPRKLPPCKHSTSTPWGQEFKGR